MKSKYLFILMALMLCMGVFCVPALASAEPEPDRLTVSTAWSDGDLLRVEILDNLTGAVSAVELRLSDYAANAETITIQAVDADGKKSGSIVINNPFYRPSAPVGSGGSDAPAENTPPPSQSSIPDDGFTFDGTGTVVDNVTEQNGKEFFSITTEAGNEFFLIVDRHRNGENVYLLNAVTENDLMALAEKGDGTTQSGIPNPNPPATAPPTPEPEVTPEPEPQPQDTGTSTGSIVFIVLVVAAAGGAGYYFKIVRPKKQAPVDDDEDDYEDDPEPEQPDDSDYETYEEDETE